MFNRFRIFKIPSVWTVISKLVNARPNEHRHRHWLWFRLRFLFRIFGHLNKDTKVNIGFIMFTNEPFMFERTSPTSDWCWENRVKHTERNRRSRRQIYSDRNVFSLASAVHVCVCVCLRHPFSKHTNTNAFDFIHLPLVLKTVILRSHVKCPVSVHSK